MLERNRSNSPTILVVEDEWLLREMVGSHLREAGWNVIEAASGEDALLLLERAPNVDVVFTDIRLNGTLNGWDVGEACRRTATDLPVIYTSGRSIEPPRRVNDSVFLEKPYEPDEVRLACERLLSKRVTH